MSNSLDEKSLAESPAEVHSNKDQILGVFSTDSDKNVGIVDLQAKIMDAPVSIEYSEGALFLSREELDLLKKSIGDTFDAAYYTPANNKDIQVRYYIRSVELSTERSAYIRAKEDIKTGNILDLEIKLSNPVVEKQLTLENLEAMISYETMVIARCIKEIDELRDFRVSHNRKQYAAQQEKLNAKKLDRQKAEKRLISAKQKLQKLEGTES